jgi:hypothetical protein
MPGEFQTHCEKARLLKNRELALRKSQTEEHVTLLINHCLLEQSYPSLLYVSKQASSAKHITGRNMVHILAWIIHAFVNFHLVQIIITLALPTPHSTHCHHTRLPD